ncbi:hypothetical protein ACFQ1S_05730 [Kibdelosporangium lantanae]|uniref:Uncharacterized protein n=1 Tax=Kibdelosporangium lantanae TaxID=1497396 RepID=A0ABW3M691_9PSEU
MRQVATFGVQPEEPTRMLGMSFVGGWLPGDSVHSPDRRPWVVERVAAAVYWKCHSWPEVTRTGQAADLRPQLPGRPRILVTCLMIAVDPDKAVCVTDYQGATICRLMPLACRSKSANRPGMSSVRKCSPWIRSSGNDSHGRALP